MNVRRIRLLVGKHPGDSGPSIAGCVDELIWEIEGQEHTEARWEQHKEDFGPMASEYTWREVVVEIPEAEIMRYFDTPTIQGRVDTSEPEVSA